MSIDKSYLFGFAVPVQYLSLLFLLSFTMTMGTSLRKQWAKQGKLTKSSIQRHSYWAFKWWDNSSVLSRFLKRCLFFLHLLQFSFGFHGFLVLFFSSYSMTCCLSTALILTARLQPSVASRSSPDALLWLSVWIRWKPEKLLLCCISK